MSIIKGYTTKNNKWECLTDKDIVKHDFLMLLFTQKGECDWNPTLGTTLLNQLFQYKTEDLKSQIIEELEETVRNMHLIKLNSISSTEIEKGWIFHLSILYVEDDMPEEWNLELSENTISQYKSTGNYPLIV